MNWRYWATHPHIAVRRVKYELYRLVHPDTPWWAPNVISFIEGRLPRHGIGFEFGSGKSTIWLAYRLEKLVAIEHDDNWFLSISRHLAKSNICNVDYRLIHLDHPVDEPTKPHYDPLPRYVASILEFPDNYFDFIEIDGHYRQACVLASLQKLKPGGMLLIDDTNWLPLEDWGVPRNWPILCEGWKYNTKTTVWQRPS